MRPRGLANPAMTSQHLLRNETGHSSQCQSSARRTRANHKLGRRSRKLAQAQSDADRWSKVAASPTVSPQTALAARQAARSSAAAVELCQKALAWRDDPEKADKEHQLSQLSLNLLPLSKALQPTQSPSASQKTQNSPPQYALGLPETPSGAPNKQPTLSKAQSERADDWGRARFPLLSVGWWSVVRGGFGAKATHRRLLPARIRP